MYSVPIVEAFEDAHQFVSITVAHALRQDRGKRPGSFDVVPACDLSTATSLIDAMPWLNSKGLVTLLEGFRQNCRLCIQQQLP